MGDDNLFGDLNRDGQADWGDDMLGLWTLEMLQRQQRQAEEADRAGHEPNGSSELYGRPSWSPSNQSTPGTGLSAGSGAAGLAVLLFGGLLLAGGLCALLGR